MYDFSVALTNEKRSRERLEARRSPSAINLVVGSLIAN